jgi:carbon starvation protein
MSSLVIAAVSLICLALGYIFYGRFVAKWIGIDYDQKTPAVEMEDGVDYVPAKHWTILFGHHFASIAGAAPIIGPVIACLFWGWLPSLIWIVIGGIFFGAVHDFISLTLSIQNKGISVVSLTESILGKTARVIFSIFVALALILVVAVFAALAGKTLASTPQVVLPTFGLVGVAVLVGALVYKTQIHLAISSLIGGILLVGLILAGYYLPITLPVSSPDKWWTIILLIYGMVAAVLPVTVLLQPRDHLAAIVLFFGLLAGFVGLAITNPVMKSPAIASFKTIQGGMWPMMMVVVACGALSGFHSLVASGTTSKQLPTMKDARKIGFGGMILESVLAVLAVIAVAAGLYWKSVPAGESGYTFQACMEGGNVIGTFGRGYGELTSPIFLGVGYLVGITMLKTFIMTTLDSATRITRYIFTELLGDAFNIKLFRNRYATTGLIGILAGWLALTNWQAIWPVFGSSNQLIAAMVFIIASVYLLTHNRRVLFAAVPAVIMLLTTITALIYKTIQFLSGGKYALGVISIILVLLAFFVTIKGVLVFKATGKSG